MKIKSYTTTIDAVFWLGKYPFVIFAGTDYIGDLTLRRCMKLEENKVDREEESLWVLENQRQEDRREQEGEEGEVE